MTSFKNTTSSAAILALLDLLKEKGVSLDQISTRTGIKRSIIDIPDLHISLDQMTRLWELGKQVSGDPALGLHLRSRYGKNFMHFVISIAKNSSTLLEGARVWCRYGRLICDTDRAEVREEGDLLKIVHFNVSLTAEKCPSMVEHDLATMLEYGRGFINRQFKPVEVHFVHTEPEYTDEYEKIFQCPILVEREENMVSLRRQDMEERIPTRDPHLHATLKKHADIMMDGLKEPETVSCKVEEHIIRNLPAGPVDIEGTSSALSMSRSTLHRKLKAEHTTFSNLLKDTRKTLSKAYLKKEMNTAQISLLLGFTDPSTFQHAFRRWYGISPGEFRKSVGR